MIGTAWVAMAKFFSENPIARWVVAIGAWLIGWEMLKGHLKKAGRDAERKAIAVKQAQVKAAVVEHQSEIIEKERTNADAALQARDRELPAASFDELPDEVQRVLDRSARGN